MKQLGGHPVAMRTVLQRLEKLTAAQVLVALRTNLESFRQQDDPQQARLYATLAFVEQSLPEQLRPLLTVVALHQGFVDADYIEAMAKDAGTSWSRSEIDALMNSLCVAGLLRDLGQSIYEMHPLLTSYLRSAGGHRTSEDERDRWIRAFVRVMEAVGGPLAPKELHEQRTPFHLHGENFYHALAEAERLGMPTESLALTQALAAFSQNSRNFVAARKLFESLAVAGNSSGNSEIEAVAYHQLGSIAVEQRDFPAAQLWYRKSLAIEESRGNERGAASTYHQLGVIAVEQRDFAAAEQWYRKSLEIEERQGNERGAAGTYHQLGSIAVEQRDFAAAEQWYRRSLEISEKQGNERDAAGTYHQMGTIATELRDFAAAEQWYRKSLAIKEKQGNEHGAASTYYQLGLIAQAQRDFTDAEQWLLKSLAIEENQGNEHGAAFSYCQLGFLARAQGNFIEASRWLLKGLLIFLHMQDRHSATKTSKHFMQIYNAAPPQDQQTLKIIWQDAGLGELPQ